MNFKDLDRTLKQKAYRLTHLPKTKETFFLRFIPRILAFMTVAFVAGSMTYSKLDLIITTLGLLFTAIILFTPIFDWLSS